MENVFLTSLTTPEVRQMFRDELTKFFEAFTPLAPQQPQTKYVAMKEAEIITSKTANALRVQISAGKLKSIKKGSRHYFDRAYLENWIAGIEDLNELEVKKKGATK